MIKDEGGLGLVPLNLEIVIFLLIGGGDSTTEGVNFKMMYWFTNMGIP